MSAEPTGAYEPMGDSVNEVNRDAEVVTASNPRCGSSSVMRPDDFCTKPATVPVTVACVHEHVRDSRACPEHAAALEDHMCAPCFHADGHRCRLMLLASEVAS